MEAVKHVRDCIDSPSVFVLRVVMAGRYAGGHRDQETGSNRPNLESAWRIEGDLQLMFASFAGEKPKEKLATNGEDRSDSSTGQCEACGYSVPVVDALSLSVGARAGCVAGGGFRRGAGPGRSEIARSG